MNSLRCRGWIWCVAWEQVVPQGASFAFQVADQSVSVSAFALFLAQFDVLASVLEHGVHKPGEFVCRGGDGFGRTQVGFLASEEGTECRMAILQTIGSQPEGGGSAIGVGFGSSAEAFAARDIASGGESQPGGEMLVGGPAGHVEADLGDELEGRLGIDALDGGEIDAADAEKMGADVEGGLILLAAASVGGFVKRLAGAMILESGQVIFDVGVAGGDLLAVEVEKLEGLAESEEVFGSPIALEGEGDGGLIVLAAVVPELGQAVRIALACQDGAQDPHAGDAGDIADHVMELEVHLFEGLLHVLNVVGSVAGEHLALAQVAAQDADLIFGAKGGLEQPVGMELL